MGADVEENRAFWVIWSFTSLFERSTIININIHFCISMCMTEQEERHNRSPLKSKYKICSVVDEGCVTVAQD